MSVDRNNWKSYHFGDIAQNIIERAMPVPDDKEKYIGLEHMDSGSLHISRWGSETELIGEKLRIKKGDMLFARRNAYLKRVAVAPFDGIFSAHGMVLRPNTALIAPEFFPFFMLSDMFLDEAIRISVGSLSPTVNWGTLKKLHFDIPPIEEQKRMAEMLWAADRAQQAYRLVQDRILTVISAYVGGCIYSSPAKMIPFHELWTKSPDSGCSAPEPSQDTGHYVLSLSALSKNGYAKDNLKRANPSETMLRAILHEGDLLISRSNTSELVGFAGIYSDDTTNVSFPDTMMRLNLDENKAVKEYIELVLLSEYGRRAMKKICAGTSNSMKKINRKTLGDVLIPLPSVEEQLILVSKHKYLQDTLQMTKKHIEAHRYLIDMYLNAKIGRC